MKRKPTFGLLAAIYVPMFALGMIIDLVVSNWYDASYAIGWLFGVLAALWYSTYVVNYVRDREGGGHEKT